MSQIQGSHYFNPLVAVRGKMYNPDLVVEIDTHKAFNLEKQEYTIVADGDLGFNFTAWVPPFVLEDKKEVGQLFLYINDIPINDDDEFGIYLLNPISPYFYYFKDLRAGDKIRFELSNCFLLNLDLTLEVKNTKILEVDEHEYKAKYLKLKHDLKNLIGALDDTDF
jgi:hypothetical protein